MNFLESLNYLSELGHETLAMKFGLQNTQVLLAAFDHPERSFLKIQIAGTNGKGSVSAFLEAICRAANLNTGLYTSPHLVEITERIKIGGREISRSCFADLTTKVRKTSERLMTAGQLTAPPTFFEHLTVIALLAFRAAEVDIAILETGLGGRLDSTTAAAAEIAGITPISLDHQEHLGATLSLIAAEKAAIIRSTSRVVVSSQEPAALRAILTHCSQVGNLTPLVSPCRYQIKDFSQDGKIVADFKTQFGKQSEKFENVRVNLPGRHQLENASVAIGLAKSLENFGLEIPVAAIIQGLQTAVHAGRLELWKDFEPPFLFDGAHNAAGAKALRKFFAEFYHQTPLTIIFGAMRDKAVADMTAELFPPAVNVVLTRADNPRSAMPEDLQKFVAPPSLANVYLAPSVQDALQCAQKITTANGLVCVTGSLYLVGEAQKILRGLSLRGRQH